MKESECGKANRTTALFGKRNTDNIISKWKDQRRDFVSKMG